MKKIKSHEEEKKDIISMKIWNFNENTRVHVLASNFVSSDDLMWYTKLNSVVKNSIVSEQFRLSQWKNAFMSNRKLGDEFRYVFDRRYLKRFTGNSLDKPQILLKRMKIRDTTYEEEVVGLGDKYQSLFLGENKKMDYPQLHVEHSVCGSPGYSPQNACLYRMESKGSNFAYPYRQTLQIANKQKYYNSGPTNYRDSLVSDQYKSYLNFLKHAGLVRSNLTPDKNGNLSFSIPSGRYTKLSAIVCDMENVVQVDVELPTKNYILNKRNLALLKPLDPKKHYNEIRKTVNFLKGEKIKITDISTTYYNVVDSIDKVKKLQLEIAKMDGCDIWPDLLFLANWDKLSLEDKNKKYSSYFCHETNLFLYFKDREFFNQVVQPFIMNKYEKSIIDNWLLGNYEKIESLASVEFYDNLNAIEKILLIYILVLKEDTVEIAKRLVERIKLNSEAVEENQEYRNIWFDAVINTLKEEDLKSKKSEWHEIISDEDEFHKRSLPLIPTEDIPMSPSYVHCQNNIVKLNQHVMFIYYIN